MNENKKDLRFIFRKVGRSIANLEYEYSLEEASPEFCIQLLTYPNLKMFSKLHRKLKISNKEWITDFIQFKGIFSLLQSVEYLCNKKQNTTWYNSLVLSKCVCCIKEILNLKYGMECIIDLANQDLTCVSVLSKATLNPNQVVKKEIFQIFCAMAMYSDRGYSLCLRILEYIKKERNYPHIFSVLIEEINNNMNTPSYLTVLAGYINCVLSQPEDLKTRLNMRVDLLNLKLSDSIEELKKINDGDLSIQLGLFEEFLHEDQKEAFIQNGFDLNNPSQVFNAIYLKNQNSKNVNQKFLELLQLLYQLSDDEFNSNMKNKFEYVLNFIVSTLRDITLKGKLVPILSEKSTQTSDIFVNKEMRKNQLNKNETSNNDSILAKYGPPPPPPPPPPQQDSNQPPPIPPKRLKKKEIGLTSTSSDSNDLNNNSIKKELKNDVIIETNNKKTESNCENSSQSSTLSDPPPPPPIFSNQTCTSSIPPPPPPPPFFNNQAGTSSVPPPPPPPPFFNNQAGTSSVPPPPPPPPFFNNQTGTSSVPPPPPPPPFFGQTGSSVAPPPPPPPPFIFGNQKGSSSIPPPPPPLGPGISSSNAINSAINTLENSINSNLTIYSTLPKSSKPLKNLGWQKLPNTALGQNNVWKELNEKNQDIKLDFNLLEELFIKTNQLIMKSNQADIGKTNVMPLNKMPSMPTNDHNNSVVSFLDPKQNMNVNVYLKKIKIPLQDFINLITNGKSKEIGLDNLNCLKKILPEKTEVDNIHAFCNMNLQNKDLLGKAEKFIKLLTDVPFYELRINLMSYIEEFDDQYTLLNNPLEVYLKTTKSILNSASLKSFIRLVLAAGNFINMNSYNGQAIGFKINILPKLIEIKTNKPSISFLHVIVEQYEKEDHGSDNFINDLKDLSLIINNNLPNLSTDFKFLKKKTIEFLDELNQDITPNDVKNQFLSQLEGCKNRISVLENSFSEIEDLKTKLIEFYCEDALTFNMDQFLTVFRDLCNNINTVKEEIRLKIQNEEKILRRKQELNEIEAKRKSLRDSNQSLDKKLGSSNEEDDNVLTNLLSNLKRGNMKSIRRSVIIQPSEEINSKSSEVEDNLAKNRTFMRANFKNNKANFFNVSTSSRELK